MIMPVTTEVADHFNLSFTDHPYWSESSWFSFHIPERNINGAFYNHFRPNMNCMLAGVFIWDLSGAFPFEALYFDWQAMRVPPEGRYGIDYDKYGFDTPWGMSLRMLEPLRRYALRYERPSFTLQLEFEAIAEAHEIARKQDHGLTNAYAFHFEQAGRISGTFGIDGEEYRVDSFSIRDGSHGPRFLEVMTPNGYTWSTGNARTGWHILAPNAGGARDSLVVGGYILRDGVVSSIVEGNRRVIARNGPRPSLVEVTARDALGRTLEAVGRQKVPSSLTLFPDRATFWQQFAWDYDGIEGAVGEDQETYGLHDFRKWNRADPALWATR
jgi:hypothetical protein